MEISTRKVVFTGLFQLTTLSVLKYIAETSPRNAEKFAADLEIFLDEIKKYPEIYKEFKPWATKSKWYRYRIFKKNYLIIFKVTSLHLLFVRLEYAKRNPDYYKELKKN
jgi:hypothetical protein